MKKILALCLLAGVLGIAGCGYTARSALPERMRTVYIEPFKNKLDYTATSGDRSVYIPLLEIHVRDAIADRFLFDGNLRIVSDAEDADLVLKGEVLEFKRNPLRYTDDDDVQEYRIQIVTALELMDVRRNEPMWAYGRFIGQSTYFLIGPQAVSEEEAIQEAVVDLSKRIVERTIENW